VLTQPSQEERASALLVTHIFVGSIHCWV